MIRYTLTYKQICQDYKCSHLGVGVPTSLNGNKYFKQLVYDCVNQIRLGIKCYCFTEQHIEAIRRIVNGNDKIKYTFIATKYEGQYILMPRKKGRKDYND